ncbi:hybrid signal transduction histidine kinase M, partial [Tanacetum coccineum]
KASSSTTNPEWCKLDDLIKMWIIGSLCDSLQEQVVTTSGNAKALWDHLQNLFHDNKDAKAINLDNELHSIKIENMYINEYCTKIKSMADRLKNLGCVVSDKNLVIYAVNGLDSRFATLVKIIRLPTFETAQNMLLLKESSMNDQSGASTTFENSSSSPTILGATNSSDNKGTCKFGDRCKFIHDHRNRAGLTSKPNSSTPSSIGRHAASHNTCPTSSGPIHGRTCTTAGHVFSPPPTATR